jgi:hypothetical protein
VIGKVLQDAAVLPENVYNMDKSRVMLSKLGSVKALAGKDDGDCGQSRPTEATGLRIPRLDGAMDSLTTDTMTLRSAYSSLRVFLILRLKS